MVKKDNYLPDYWSVYKAINFQRLSKHREYVDRKSWKTMKYEFIWAESMQSVFMQLFSGVLWLSPVVVIFMLATCYVIEYPEAYFYAALAIIGYHFAAMYYIIRWPFLKISTVKKGIFSKK